MSNKKEELKATVKDENDVETEVKFYITRPGNDVIKRADRYRARMWNECVTDGVPTKTQMSKMLVERGIWSDTKDADEAKIIEDINRLEKELYLGDGKSDPKLSDGQLIAINIRKKRIKLQELLAEKLEMEQNTAEALADNARFDFLVANCTFHPNGEKVYNNVEDYDARSDEEVAVTAANALAKMLYSLEQDFYKALPENKWLLEHKLVDDKLSLVNQEGKLVDISGRLIDKNGRYINSDGKHIDKDGNLLNEDGTYVSTVEYKDDLHTQKKKPKVKRARARTKTVTDSEAGSV